MKKTRNKEDLLLGRLAKAREARRHAYRSVEARYAHFVKARTRFLAADKEHKRILKALGREQAKDKATAALQKMMRGAQ